jgi:hypothetical protein
MGTYTDKLIDLKGHRLTLYEPGYGLAAILNLMVLNPLDFTYQYRITLLQIATYIQTHRSPRFSLLITGDRFSITPLILRYLITTPERLSFFLERGPTNIKKNILVQECASDIKNMISSDLNSLYPRLLDRPDNKILAIEHSNIELLTLLESAQKAREIHAIKKIFIFNYAKESAKSMYFELKSQGFQIIEQADGVGSIEL